ncbi:PDZ domain-containing protein [Sporosalibacterium faouarense]|uniref:PDZ domain-containing protein n=1 Tax=Sporosalibacterium faouarense TaxID=516123 RepID=UPI00192A80CE|nr:PDZ domain-containing protein [Sporosalibacterium faouarense]
MINIIDTILSGFITIATIIRNPIYWIVILLVLIQYRRIYKMEKQILGINKESILITILKSSILGIIGGVVGSILIMLLGISIEANDFKYLFIVAIILMLIHPRFICFSYSGGIISISSLVLGYPKINVSSVIAIVAILHLIESLLIFIDGDSTKIPMFIERDNRIVGGFNMMRFWPIPFIVLIMTSQSSVNIGLRPSDWWPIFNSSGSKVIYESMVYLMAGVIAALGYGDMAITDLPKNKIRNSSRNLFIYSCILLTLATISTYSYIFKIIAALFAPIVHEFIIQMGRKREKNGSPIFVPSSKGIRVLDTLPKGFGNKIGLQTGDVILSINGFAVRNKEELSKILYYSPKYVLIDYLNTSGKIITKEYRDYKKGIRSLGILAVPDNTNISFVAREAKSPLLILFDRIRRIRKK